MPQASDELRSKMEEYFGNPISDAGPDDYLRSEGFKLIPGWVYQHPDRIPWDKLPQKTQDCIHFMCDEWDYGGYYD